MVGSRYVAILVTLLGIVLAACGGGSPVATGAPSAQPATQAPGPTITQAPATAAPATAEPATSAPQASTNPLGLATLFQGTWAGTWTNTTFGSNGPLSLVVTTNPGAGTVTLTIDIGGNVFGEPDPDPDTVTITPDGDGTFTYDSERFGEVTVTLDVTAAGGEIKITAPDVPSARIATFSATSTVTSLTTLDFDYEVTFEDGGAPAEGVATLTKS